MGTSVDQGDGVRVVLVDDDEDMRMLLRVALAACDGAEVVGEAANGRQGVDVVTATNPDIVVMDLHMPVMDGAEATREIKQARPETRVLAFTSTASDEDHANLIEAGVDRRFDKSEIKELIEFLGC
jgi:DNA-binding NarL/FixJ family response regulator